MADSVLRDKHIISRKPVKSMVFTVFGEIHRFSLIGAKLDTYFDTKGIKVGVQFLFENP